MLSVPSGKPVKLAGRGTTYVREVGGPPGAPSVVLLHGLGATGAINWPGAFEALAPWFRVIAIDQRGHGRGIHRSRPFRLRDCADDVAALAEALEIERMIAVGYSMGGAVALLARRRHPERVAGLVLCATAARFGPEGSDSLGASLPLGMPLRLLPPAVRRAMTGSAVRTVLGDDLPPTAIDEVGRHDPVALADALQSLRRFDGRRWVGDLNCPAASVVTVADAVVPAFRQVELALMLDAPVVPVESDHLVATFAPPLFLPALVTACRSVSERL